MRRLVRLFCACLLSVSSLAIAQNLGTGLYGFGSFDSKGFDSINLGNLNTHFEIPLVNKPGRGLAFNYAFAYDGLVWSSSTSMGSGYWQPDSNFGFHGQLSAGAFTGFVTYSVGSISCPRVGSRNITGTINKNYVYHDPYGRNHSFKYTAKNCVLTDIDGPTITGDGSTSDGSGLSYGPSDYFVHTRSGATISAPINMVPGQVSIGSITDSNGNTITNNGGTFTDTLGVTALTIAGNASAGSHLTFTYPVSLQADSATSAAVTVYYRTYTVQTNFQCSGISENGATSVDLVDHIVLPDSAASTYSFSYEATPGIGGAVTGRLASITLPTGGAINYAYSGGCNNSGINTDGTPATLSRTTTDGTKTYSRTINSTGSTTSTTDEKQNQAVYTFTSNIDNFWYETDRKIWQGAASGTPLQDRITQYNTQTTPTQLTSAITQVTVLESSNGGTQTQLTTTYDSSGLPLTSAQGPSGGAPLQSQSMFYNSLGDLTGVSSNDSSGAFIATTTYGYDETAPIATSGIPQHGPPSGTRHNQTSAHIQTSPVALDSTVAYYDTGVPVSTATPNGTTQYSYDSTQTFTTQVTLPTPSSGVQLGSTAGYDQQSGVQVSATGVNADQTQVLQYDRLLRPTVLSLPNGGRISYTHTSNQTGVAQSMDASTNMDTETLLDSYGRVSRSAVYNGQSSNVWYLVDYCYDTTGLLQFQSTKYQDTGFNAAKRCSGPGTTYVHDALGRMTSRTNADGTASYQYNIRAVLTTDVNNVQKIVQSDLLGRTSAICEISSNASMPGSGTPVNCGMDIGGTGFLTTYSYDLANHKTTITQGGQQRVFQTDQAGRTIYTSEPERGVTTYSYVYNPTGLAVTRTKPRANQTDPAVKTNTVTQYDSVGRVLSTTYDDGTPTKNFTYDASVGWPNFGQSNVKGMLSSAYVTTASGRAETVFSYDVMGRPSGMVECLPSGCGNSAYDKHLSYAFDLAGNMLSASDGGGVTTSYSYTPASEVQSISSSLNDATHPGTLVSNVQNGPHGPLSYQSGNGAITSFSYDTLGRRNGGWVCNNSSQNGCIGGTQLYGYVANWKGLQVIGSADTALNQQSSYGYDEFNRLTSKTVTGTAQNYTYVYDRYGNRWQQNALQGGPSPQLSFDSSNNRISGYGYDAAGNVMSDGINSYQYDAEGNLIQETSGSTFKYTFSAFNQQVRADYGSIASENVFSQSGQIVSLWYSGGTVPIMGKAYWGSTPIESYLPAANMAYFQHWDWLGSLRLETNGTGAVSSLRTTLPFGDGWNNVVGNRDNSFDGFAGMWDGKTTSTNHAQYREYSNISGRWMSPDPYSGSYHARSPQSFNRYAYAMNRPLSATDPMGLALPGCSWELCEDNGEGGGSGGCPDPNTCITVTADPEPPVSTNPGGCLGSCGAQAPQIPSGPDRSGTGPGAPNNGQVPVHGPWTYGNHCGAGGMGNPINGTDAACQTHDACYNQGGFSPGSNFQGPNAQLQACNQQLCNAVRGARQSIINQAGAAGSRTSRGVSPVYSPGQWSELQADSDINLYFTSIVPGANACH